MNYVGKLIARRVSSFLGRHPRLLFRIQEAWLRFGYGVLDLEMAGWVIRRPEWLRSKSGAGIRPLENDFRRAGDEDIEVARRSIATFQRASSADPRGLVPDDTIWGVLRNSHYGEMVSIVEQGDAQRLAAYQAQMFRTGAVNGYAYGTTFDRWPHRWNYLPVQIELSVVQLAEALGILRVENPEQGKIAFWRDLVSEDELIGAIESHFGFRVEQPKVGSPRGITFGGRFLTRETCPHLLSAHRMRLAIEREGVAGPLNIVEIGGGYGGLCYWLRKVLGARVRRYVIVDLPETGLAQAYFLGMAETVSVALWGETIETIASPIQILPHFALSEIDFRPNVMINQDSMPEMPESEVERYLAWGEKNLDGIFLSFNQEVYAGPDVPPQVWTPEIIRRFPRFERCSRELAWDRRGYVEEVYRTI